MCCERVCDQHPVYQMCNKNNDADFTLYFQLKDFFKMFYLFKNKLSSWDDIFPGSNRKAWKERTMDAHSTINSQQMVLSTARTLSMVSEVSEHAEGDASVLH